MRLTAFVEIATVASTDDSVKFPAAAAGLQVIITNHGANAGTCFPASGDKINEASGDAAKALAADASLLCYAQAATDWECLTLAR